MGKNIKKQEESWIEFAKRIDCYPKSLVGYCEVRDEDNAKYIHIKDKKFEILIPNSNFRKFLSGNNIHDNINKYFDIKSYKEYDSVVLYGERWEDENFWFVISKIGEEFYSQEYLDKMRDPNHKIELYSPQINEVVTESGLTVRYPATIKQEVLNDKLRELEENNKMQVASLGQFLTGGIRIKDPQATSTLMKPDLIDYSKEEAPYKWIHDGKKYIKEYIKPDPLEQPSSVLLLASGNNKVKKNRKTGFEPLMQEIYEEMVAYGKAYDRSVDKLNNRIYNG